MQTLFEQLHNGHLVITPNNRLSAILQEDYFAWCSQSVVDKPACMPYNNLIVQHYQRLMIQYHEDSWPRLLTDRQTQYLWRDILKAHTSAIYSEGLFASVFSAWNQCMLWNISPTDPRFSYTPQTRQFQEWWQVFNQKLQAMDALCEQEIVSKLVQYPECLSFDSIIWLCFDSFTPQQKQLQQHITDSGIRQEYLDLPEITGHAYQYQAENSEEEWLQIVHFLKENLAKGQPSIGIVVPDIQEKATSLQRFLSRHIATDLFNISLGQSLQDFPLVAHALSFLSLEKENITHQQARLLLVSPYIKDSEKELVNRIQWLQDSVLLQAPTINLADWIQELKPQVPVLSSLLETLPPLPDKASPQEWIEACKERLIHLGYPGDYGLYSENYQCFHKWMGLLDELAELESLSAIFHRQEALSIIKNMAAHTIFQPQRAATPIHILGMLEASGCRFSALWVCGLTDQCLPEKVRLSPFIPHAIQKETSMPHSLPQKELALATQIIERFQKSAETVIFSYAAFQEDKPELPSPLIQHLAHFVPSPLLRAPFISPLIATEETWRLPLNPTEKISGGTRLLANQSQCPFKAFAAHRLHAKPMPEVTEGLIPATRGQLIHQVMETVWTHLQSQEALCNLTETDLEVLIDKAIIQALKKIAPKSLPELIRNLEINRLNALVKASLEWEKQRPPFTIEALEKTCSIKLHDLEIKMRVDRLDSTESGQKWVIDYKTTLPQPKPWHEERIQEPQLLLYALLDEAIETLLYMELKQGRSQISGFSSEKMTLKGMQSLPKDKTWQDLRQQWKNQLEQLAEEFLQGHHPPTPQNTALCASCEFQNLCRFG